MDEAPGFSRTAVEYTRMREEEYFLRILLSERRFAPLDKVAAAYRPPWANHKWHSCSFLSIPWHNPGLLSVRFRKRPPFCSPQTFQESTRSSVHHLQYPTRRKEKMSQYFNHNMNSLNTYTVINVWNNCDVADNQSNILGWLSPLNPKSPHQEI